MRFEVNFCKAFDFDVLGLRNMKRCGNFNGCPFHKGKTYNICNWIVDEKKFPPGIPTGKYKLQLSYMYFSEEVVVLDAYCDIVNSWYIF
ncbi:hypothetical protein ILUMI_11148 [Ignelater luminosus]|uniref:Uncharacterized protein n=1 Tax=Ignelater luminosus TaxID=2038154 RepID=A0A8K0D0P1_IGNLU|nr:hypothetical protein ILUMI_11148 [Ignelater luminosus]